MRFQLNPFAPNGVSVVDETKKTNQSHGYLGNSGIPPGGYAGQVLQKASSSQFVAAWGPALTVSNTAPSNPSVNDLWIDTT
jgi:hypothetical protein